MDAKLFAQAIVKFLCGLLMVGLLLFLPAGTFAWWQGWLLMGILFVPMFIAGLVMMKNSQSCCAGGWTSGKRSPSRRPSSPSAG